MVRGRWHALAQAKSRPRRRPRSRRRLGVARAAEPLEGRPFRGTRRKEALPGHRRARVTARWNLRRGLVASARFRRKHAPAPSGEPARRRAGRRPVARRHQGPCQSPVVSDPRRRRRPVRGRGASENVLCARKRGNPQRPAAGVWDLPRPGRRGSKRPAVRLGSGVRTNRFSRLLQWVLQSAASVGSGRGTARLQRKPIRRARSFTSRIRKA